MEAEDPRLCERCGLAATRKNVVISRGQPAAKFVIVGEAPGADEDAQGLPFIGRAGRVLDKCLRTAGVPPEAITITNIVRCRPPENRNPLEVEVNTCTAWLEVFLRECQPHVVVALGRFSIGYFKGYTREHIEKMKVGQEVGTFCRTTCLGSAGDDIMVMPSWHPAYVLRAGGWAVEALIEHLQKARALHNRLARPA